MNLGISTGSFYEFDWSYDQKIAAISSLGVQGIEIGLHKVEELSNFNISAESKEILKNFEWKSLHAMKFDYDNNTQTRDVLSRLEMICKELNVNSVSLHPDVVKDWNVLSEFKIPFSIENMDIRKQSGFSLEEMKQFRDNLNYSFVIDLQHIWEHDNSMQFGYDMIELLGDRISHFHISGCKPGIVHEAIHSSNNKEAIVNVIKKINTEKFMITEGLFHNGLEDAKKEIELLLTVNDKQSTINN